MRTDTANTTGPKMTPPPVICEWTARKMQPVILLYVILIFAAFVLIAHFIFHSDSAVQALLLAAVSSVIPLVPGVLSQTEYRLTRLGLEQRPVLKNKPAQFKIVFELARLDHIKPLNHGFKYYLVINESGALRRFMKKHFLSGFSGQVHIEKGELKTVLNELAAMGVKSA